MSVHKIAGRYAKSLLDLAVERNELEQVKTEMDAFVEATQNRDLYLLLKSPIIHGSKKQSIMDEIFGKSFGELTSRFISICINKGREGLLPDIAKAFLEMYERRKGISRIKIITAKELSKDELAVIEDRLLNSDATDKSVTIEVEVDASLIGGFVLEFDNKRYDASVLNKLNGLRKEFTDNPYVSKIIAS